MPRKVIEPVEVTCKQCGNIFKIKRFKIKDGRGKYCSVQCGADSRRTSKEHQLKLHNKRSKKYYKAHSSKHKEACRKWRKNNPKFYLKIRKNIKAKYPLKYKARKIAATAIERGKLIRQPCVICKSTKRVEAHHPDYAKPLDVVWLCEVHHKAWHRVFIPENA